MCDKRACKGGTIHPAGTQKMKKKESNKTDNKTVTRLQIPVGTKHEQWDKSYKQQNRKTMGRPAS